MVGGLAACTAPPIPSPASQISDASYGTRHPYYFEFCALSEIQKKPGYGADIRGGVGGHSTIYLNGACLKGAGYPELQVCKDDPADKRRRLERQLPFRERELGCDPRSRLLLSRRSASRAALTRAVYDATKAHAKRLGIYDAIRFHDDVFDDMPPGYTRDAFKYEVSIGDRLCDRLRARPVLRAGAGHRGGDGADRRLPEQLEPAVPGRARPSMNGTFSPTTAFMSPTTHWRPSASGQLANPQVASDFGI